MFEILLNFRMVKVIGPKCSSCCFVVAAWVRVGNFQFLAIILCKLTLLKGIVMFTLLGAFFYTKSPALRVDVVPATNNRTDVFTAYEGNAYNCFITAGELHNTFETGN